MAKFLQRFDLGLESHAKSFVGRHAGRKHFDGDPLSRLGVDSLVDGAHAALADFLSQAIGTELLELHGTNPCRPLVR